VNQTQESDGSLGASEEGGFGRSGLEKVDRKDREGLLVTKLPSAVIGQLRSRSVELNQQRDALPAEGKS
jgi:hypothetical protein